MTNWHLKPRMLYNREGNRIQRARATTTSRVMEEATKSTESTIANPPERVNTAEEDKSTRLDGAPLQTQDRKPKERGNGRLSGWLSCWTCYRCCCLRIGSRQQRRTSQCADDQRVATNADSEEGAATCTTSALINPGFTGDLSGTFSGPTMRTFITSTKQGEATTWQWSNLGVQPYNTLRQNGHLEPFQVLSVLLHLWTFFTYSGMYMSCILLWNLRV